MSTDPHYRHLMAWPAPGQQSAPAPATRHPISAVERLRLQSGDAVVLRYEGALCTEHRERLVEFVRRQVPADIRVIVLPEGLRLQQAEYAPATVAQIRSAMARYELALQQRRHGGVAAGEALSSIKQILEAAHP